MRDPERIRRIFDEVTGEQHRKRNVAGATAVIAVGGVYVAVRWLHEHRSDKLPYDDQEMHEYDEILKTELRNPKMSPNELAVKLAALRYVLGSPRPVKRDYLFNVTKGDGGRRIPDDTRIKVVSKMISAGRLLLPHRDAPGTPSLSVKPGDAAIYAALNPEAWPELALTDQGTESHLVLSGSSQNSGESRSLPPEAAE